MRFNTREIEGWKGRNKTVMRKRQRGWGHEAREGERKERGGQENEHGLKRARSVDVYVIVYHG
jgi:hypothetical protein